MPICVHNLLQDLVQNALYPRHWAKIVLVKVCTFRYLLVLVNCYSCRMVLLFVNNTFLLAIKILLCCKCKWKISLQVYLNTNTEFYCLVGGRSCLKTEELTTRELRSPPDNYFPGNAVPLYWAESHSLLQLVVNLRKNIYWFGWGFLFCIYSFIYLLWGFLFGFGVFLCFVGFLFWLVGFWFGFGLVVVVVFFPFLPCRVGIGVLRRLFRFPDISL